MSYLHTLKLRMLNWLGVPLTSKARGELARWITRNVTESTEETLEHIRGEIEDEVIGKKYECPCIETPDGCKNCDFDINRDN